MGSIRPLVTITILVVVGAYLYVKINEGPVQQHAGASASNQPPDGVPPLSATKGASLSADSAAPAWPPTASSVAPPPTSAVASASVDPNLAKSPSTSSALGSSNMGKDNMPAVPAFPELPALPATPSVIPPPAAQPPTTLPKDLPAGIPTSRYPDEPGQAANATTPKDSLNQAPPLTAGATDSSKSNLPGAAAQVAVTPPLAIPALSPLQTPAPESAQNSLRTATPPTTAVPETPDRYGPTSQATTQPPGLGVPASQVPMSTDPTFAASWPAIQAALGHNDLKQAHQLLSKWHGNESLTPAETEQVETLLSQLAGTVIYSTEHKLEPARAVKPGETLETIAKEYNVPWQLLAKINSIQSPTQLRPGQELKVVRGPFSAVVDLHRSEVTLMVDDRYAGKFHVTVPPGVTLPDGQWLVEYKEFIPIDSSSNANPSAYAAASAPKFRIIKLRNAAANAAVGSPTLLITSNSPPGLATNMPPSLRVSPQDAEELSDILSIGSRVVVRK